MTNILSNSLEESVVLRKRSEEEKQVQSTDNEYVLAYFALCPHILTFIIAYFDTKTDVWWLLRWPDIPSWQIRRST